MLKSEGPFYPPHGGSLLCDGISDILPSETRGIIPALTFPFQISPFRPLRLSWGWFVFFV